MTFLEVLVSLVLLATLLTGLLAARTRAMRQQHTAERKLQAVSAADAMLEQWSLAGTIPIEGSGRVGACPDMLWQVRPTGRRVWTSQIMRLEILDSQDGSVLACVEWCMAGRPARSGGDANYR